MQHSLREVTGTDQGGSSLGVREGQTCFVGASERLGCIDYCNVGVERQCSIERWGKEETVDSGSVDLVPMRRTLDLPVSFRWLKANQDLISQMR